MFFFKFQLRSYRLSGKTLRIFCFNRSQVCVSVFTNHCILFQLSANDDERRDGRMTIGGCGCGCQGNGSLSSIFFSLSVPPCFFAQFFQTGTTANHLKDFIQRSSQAFLSFYSCFVFMLICSHVLSIIILHEAIAVVTE